MRYETVMGFFGSRTNIKAFLNVSDAALSQWENRGTIPELRALQLYWMTDHLLEYVPNEYGNDHLRKLK